MFYNVEIKPVFFYGFYGMLNGVSMPSRILKIKIKMKKQITTGSDFSGVGALCNEIICIFDKM